MNRDIYRLVFNEERNAWIAVAETVRGRGKKSARRRSAAVALGVLAALCGDAALAARPAPPLARQLPVLSSTRPHFFAGSASITTNANGDAMTIATPSRALGINWQKFDIGSDASVTFQQPDATSRVLNRIWDGDPSQIMGRLSANGEIYLINPNGVIFGSGAQVNAAGLVASAFNISEGALTRLLNAGLPRAPGEQLTLSYDGTFGDFSRGTVVVDAGATLRTASGGRVVLIAPKTVENSGLIESADGNAAEAILAAGGKVVLTAPDDPNLRGLLVETAGVASRDLLGNNVSLDGTASNKGTIDVNGTAGGGIVSLAALAVNQKGIVKASRAVNLNGTTMLVSGSGTTDTARLTINQRGDVAQIDWAGGFKVNPGQTVEFVQASAGAVAYNYINDGDRTTADGAALNTAGRTTIDGQLKANGQLVLINEKGFDFGASADVWANNIVASALGMNPNIVASGLLGQTDVTKRAFYLNPRPTSYSSLVDGEAAQKTGDALAAFRQATINVAPGARLQSGSNGYVILAGSKISHSGSIRSDNGQVVLAAGADLYLKPGYSAATRGFTAEVNPLYLYDTATSRAVIASRGADANSVVNNGTIVAPFGDITLVGNEITQAGLLYTSTSATANGSIRFIARDLVDSGSDSEEANPTKVTREYNDEGIGARPLGQTATTTDFVYGTLGGTLRFADGSVTTVAIDGSNGKTLTADQTFVKSSIDAVARKIVVGDADLEAKGGTVRFRASEGFEDTTAFASDAVIPLHATQASGDVGIYVGDGARIDVSGTDADKSVADLFIEVELRGDEFANNPLQRNGILRGKTAWVDIRDAVSVADLSGWINKVGQNVYEKAATGGTISLGSTGSVIVRNGAELDVSGGKINYRADTVKESLAIASGGKRYRLNDASSSLRYRKLLTRTRKEAAYVEGRSAGTVELVGNNLALDGQLKARTTTGTRQREIGNAATSHYARAYGGQLIVKDSGQHYAVSDRDTASEEEKDAAYAQAQIAFVSGAASAAAGLGENDPAAARLELSQTLVDNGFSRFDVSSEGRIDLPADVNLSLPVGGSFAASGRQVYVAGDISAPSGQVRLTTRDLSVDNSTKNLQALLSTEDAKYSTLTLASTASLSTAGRWVNDYLDRSRTTVAKATDGGSISLTSAYDLDLRAGSTVDVSGGGWVSYAKKLTSGNAGSITLATGGVDGGGYNFTSDGSTDRSDQATYRSGLRDASLFLDGSLSGYALGKGGALTVKTSKIVLGKTFASDSRDWTRTQRLDNDQVGAAFADDFVDRGGFFNFSFIGRDGVTVVDNARVSADPVSWSLAASRSGYLRKKTGSDIADFASAGVLSSDLRSGATRITLATRSRNYGDLSIGDNATVGVTPQGTVKLVAMGQMTVLGTLEAPAGTITLSRPATKQGDEVVDGSRVSYNADTLAYSDEQQSRSIYLGPDSRLLAQGTTVLAPRTRRALDSGTSIDALRAASEYKGTVLNGGTVSIDAGLGYLVTRSGSQIDVSGITDTLNQASLTSASANYPLKDVGSAGGKISLAAREGMLLDGAMRARGGDNALGGSFSLRFGDAGSEANVWNITAATTPAMSAALAARQLTLEQSASGHAEQWPAGLSSADYLSGKGFIDAAEHNGKATLDLATLVSGGFGSWYLSSQNDMQFAGTISASVNNQLRLDAQRFSAKDAATRLALGAAAVQIGNTATDAGTPAATASTGTASATIGALDLGLVGTFSWNGFGSTTLASQGEIHFDSVSNRGLAGRRSDNGQMTATGELTLAAARLSPSTYSDFSVDLGNDPNGRINVTRPAGAQADVSLSVGGRLELAAKTIDDQGTISAPLGEIVFNARDGQVTLGSASVTSVAADRNLLFGYTTESVSTWNYNGNKVEAMPAKGIRIDGARTVVASGAQLDLSGGGDALGWEFTSGPGGKTDLLAGATTRFAIIPNWTGRTATDGELLQSYGAGAASALKVGDRITLADNAFGLNGSYVLLPARYAVLDGAYLVTVKTTDGTVLRRSTTLIDGAQQVNATIQALNADGTTTPYATTGWTVELASKGQLAERAKYTTTSASAFFYDQSSATLAGDAGHLTAIGRQSLSFDPSVVAMRAAEVVAADGRTRAGNGLQLDLAAPKLLVSDGTGVVDAGWSSISQDKLNAIGASSLLIGGTRTSSAATTSIETIASDVTVSNTQGALTAPEVMLSAAKSLTVTSGSRIEANGDAASRALALDGDGAFVRVAAGPQASLERTGSVSRTQGDLRVEADARISGRSLILDATRNSTLAGDILSGPVQADGRRSGGALTVGAGRVSVGGGTTDANGLSGLIVSNADLQRWATADQIRLTSYSTLDLYGDAALGSASLDELIIAAAGIAGHGDGGNVATISAQRVALENPNPSTASFTPGAALGSGSLAINAGTITLGGNATTAMRASASAGFALRGFTAVGLAASGDVRFAGTGVTAIDNSGGSTAPTRLDIDAGRVVATGQADHLLIASGATKVSRHAAAAAPATDAGLGGSLEIRSKSIDVSGSIAAASGKLTLSGEDGITLGAGARVSADGARVAFADTYAYGSGGSVTLASQSGNVRIDAGATVSVSADNAGGDAGTIALLAQQGSVSTAAATLLGSANTASSQGTLQVDAASVELDDLAAAAKDSAGTRQLTGRWDIRRRSGDLQLGSEIKAHEVKLATDAGSIRIDGTIDASGSQGGRIELYANRRSGAGGHIDLGAGSRLLANATEAVAPGQGTRGRGGRVIVGVSATDAADELATGIDFAAASGGKAAALIDVSTPTGSAAPQGSVVFSAPREDTVAALKTLQNTALNWTTALVAPNAAGTASALTLASTMASYQTGMVAAFKALASANTGAVTLNVNGKGAKPVLRADGTPLKAGDIAANAVVVAVYDGSAFRLQTSASADSGTANNYKVAPTLVPLSVAEVKKPGYAVVFRAGNATTNAGSKLSVGVSADGTAPAYTSFDLKSEDGSALKTGDIVANQLVTAVFTVTNEATGAGEFRIVKNTALASGVLTDSVMAPVSLTGNVSGAASVALEGVRTSRKTGDVVLATPQQDVLMAGSVQTAALKGSALAAAADNGGRLGAVFRAGEEIRATGNITVANEWDLSRTHTTHPGGTLTLRAGGNLNVNASVSDGFNKAGTGLGTLSATRRDAQIGNADGAWSYRLVAGADANAADPLATNALAASGTIAIASGQLLRTGTGEISLAAKGDVTLDNRSAVYTAGRDDTAPLPGFWTSAPNDQSTSGQKNHYPINGGDLSIRAGGSISQYATGTLNDWLIAYDNGFVLDSTDDIVKNTTQWWARIASFQQGFGAFGGGDIALTSGGDMTRVAAVIPTSGRVPGADGLAQTDLARINGGGSLSLRSGGNINGGLFYVETGRLDVKADGKIAVAATSVATPTATSGAQLALGNAAATVGATQSIALGRIGNPLTTLGSSSGLKAGNGSALTGTAAGIKFRTLIGTYGEDSRVDVTSTNGDVVVDSANTLGNVAPARVKVAALNGSITASLAQMPESDGQLDLLAAAGLTIGSLVQYDVPGYRIAGIGNPVAARGSSGGSNPYFNAYDSTLTTRLRHSSTLWHADDHERSRLIALGGDIVASALDSLSVFSEAVDVRAGGDIRNLSLDIQHAHASDLSRIVAGGDIAYDVKNSSLALIESDGKTVRTITSAPTGITLGGAGQLEVVAGGDIDLADTWGIVTRGNLDNPYLAERGASILAVAGATPDYASLRAYLGVGSEVSDSELRQRFFALLKEYGSAAQAGGGDASYAKGRALAAAFFPTAKTGKGDIKLSFSQIKTEQGGDIKLLAPGGSVIVGVSAPSLTKKAYQQGIFTVDGGSIFSFVDRNFLVNQSRTFTLNGGDITIWADHGSIDAGSGAKTAVSTPMRKLLTRNGHLELDTANAVSGSGIGVLASYDDTPASDMSLFAPEGTIDAGDAGLRSTGNITLGARAILNSSNIQASGSVSGAPAPAAAAAPVTAAPTTPKTSDASETQATAAAAGSRETVLGTLTVEVLDNGGDAASESAGDAEAGKDDEKKKKR